MAIGCPRAPVKKKPDLPPIDEVGITRALSFPIHPEMIWEIDSFYMRQRVFEKRPETECPYHPRMLLVALHGQGIILDAEISMPWNYLEQTGFDFLKIINKLKFRPYLVLVKREELSHLLQPIAFELDINLKKVNRIPLIEAAQAGMTDIMP